MAMVLYGIDVNGNNLRPLLVISDDGSIVYIHFVVLQSIVIDVENGDDQSDTKWSLYPPCNN